MKLSIIKGIGLFLLMFFAFMFVIKPLYFINSPSGNFSTYIIEKAFKKCFFVVACETNIPLEGWGDTPWDELLIFPETLGYQEENTVMNKEKGIGSAIFLIFKKSDKVIHEEYQLIESDDFLFGVDLRIKGYQINVIGDSGVYYQCTQNSSFDVKDISSRGLITIVPNNCIKKPYNEKEMLNILNGEL